MTEARKLSAEELKLMAQKFAGSALTIAETADLFRHVAALDQELAELRKPVDEAEVRRWVANLNAAGGNQGNFTGSERLRYRTLADLITRLSRERDDAQDNALKAASRIVSGASVAVNHLPELKTPNDLAAYLTRRDLKLAEEILTLKGNS